jgi:hypothetical protein
VPSAQGRPSRLENLSVDQVMASIHDEIGISTSLWTKIRSWVSSVVLRLMQLGAKLAIGFHTAGAIGWR